MDRQIFGGREITVVVASESRKRPDDMRRRTRTREDRGSSGYGGRRSHHGGSRSRSVSRSPSPRRPSGSRSRHHSRSYSPAPRRRVDHSVSLDRRHADEPVRSPREAPKVRDRRSYSPDYENGAADHNGYNEKTAYESDEGRAHRKRSPEPASRSPSRSRSVD